MTPTADPAPSLDARPHTRPDNPTDATKRKGNPMIKHVLALHLWGLALLTRLNALTLGYLDRAAHTLTAARRERRQLGTRRRIDERGSVTIEQVIWAGAVIVIVGIVVAAITAFVRTKSNLIR